MNVWTPEIIRARFVEAVDTESRLPLGGGSSSAGFWPSYVHSFEDMNGWGSKRLAEEREMRMRRLPPSSAAISRHEEVMTWTSTLIRDERRRRLVWAWARCRHREESFGEWCQEHGVVRMTAYRHLSATVERISRILNNEGVLLRLPDEKWVLQERPVSGTDCATLGLPDKAAAPQKSPTSQIVDGARPGNTLTSPKAVAAFERHLARTNKARAKAQERRNVKRQHTDQGAA
jgi:hypothetical protein